MSWKVALVSQEFAFCLEDAGEVFLAKTKPTEPHTGAENIHSFASDFVNNKKRLNLTNKYERDTRVTLWKLEGGSLE